MKPIISNVIGELEQDEEFTEWWYGENLKIPILRNEELPVTFTGFIPEDDTGFVEQADIALTNLINLNTEKEFETLTNLVHKSCIDYINEIEEEYQDEFQEFLDITNKIDIWHYVTFNEIYVERRLWSDKDMYVSVKCNCEWEEEHGLQIVFRQGKMVTRISGIDGHITEADAYGKDDNEDFLLNEFNKNYCYKP